MSPVLENTRIWSWDEFAALPDDARYQVLDGEVFVSPHPGKPHQLPITKLIVRLDAYATKHDLGRVYPGLNIVLGPGGYLIPDVLFIPKDRAGGFGGPEGGESELWLEVPPGLVIEVLSPSTRSFDRIKKKRAYREFGVNEYWIVDPEEKRIDVYRFAGAPADAAVEPEICRERVLWQPRADLEPCEIPVAEIWWR